MSDDYQGREQTQAKHDILGRYISPFASKILSQWRSIDYIDGFSGPWENKDQASLRDTSIRVALDKFSEIAEHLGHSPQDRRIRCIFNEKTPQAFARLQDFVTSNRSEFPLLEIEIFQGSFESNAVEIRRSARNAFQLIFIDPTGFSGFPPSSLAKFNGRSSELIVNFMRSFILRFLSGTHAKRRDFLVGLLGEVRADRVLEGDLTIEAIEMEYLEMMKEDLGYKYAGMSPIHNPSRDEIQFNLAYATNHSEGMEVMRSAEFKALSSHDKNRARIKNPHHGNDLFAHMQVPVQTFGPYLRARRSHIEELPGTVLKTLEAWQGSILFGHLVALMQERFFVKRSEVADALVELSVKGAVKPTWKDRNGRRPKPSDRMMLAK